MKLVQLLLPLNDNSGKKFPKKFFKDIKEELTKKFSGVTAFSQSPAEGVWEDEGYVQKDQIIIYEVMVAEFDQNWWRDFKGKLEAKLKQEKIVLRWFDVSTL
ncbi:hypothetical protein [Nitrosomonas sp. Nm166]|uniref:hypothetical protein n=1 Tax=Nitrosomonas sp. Nm166 TaxID=1881054 RepID=UPI0008E4A714|nr:hypothetical protein [Nitrosomonas sp. Nm166]SFF20988.1 hypothetical protein SAMN05428977_10726 [Nitrosomonas sp. Nm166]